MNVPSVISTSNSRVAPNAATPSTMLCVNAKSFDADGATIATRNGPERSTGGGGGGASSAAGGSSVAGAASVAGASVGWGGGGGCASPASSESPPQAAASSAKARSGPTNPKNLFRVVIFLICPSLVVVVRTPLHPRGPRPD